MTINTYDVGGLIRCSAIFTNIAGAAVDPAVVKFKFRTPAGTITTYTYGTDAALVKDSTGNYHVDVNATGEGMWFYRFESTGTGQAAEEHNFFIANSEFG